VFETVALFEVRERMPKQPPPKLRAQNEEAKRGNRMQRLKRLNAMDNVNQTTTSEGDGSTKSVLNLKEILSQPETLQHKNSIIDLTLTLKKWDTIVEKHKRDPQFNDFVSYSLQPVIVKCNALNIRQELVVMQIMSKLNGLLQEAGCKNLFLRPYDILIISPACGIVEFLPDAKPLS
jgi:hypothetical protein